MGRRGIFGAAAAALLAAVIVAIVAGPAAADERFVGSYSVTGEDTERGAYTGSVRVLVDERDQLRVRGSYRFESGQDQRFDVRARVEGDRLTFAVVTRPGRGFEDELRDLEDGAEVPAGATRYTASYRQGEASGTLEGAWRVSRRVRRTDTWSRGGVEITRVEPLELPVGERTELVVRGRRLPSADAEPTIALRRGARADERIGIEHLGLNEDGTEMRLGVTVAEEAAIGERTLHVQDAEAPRPLEVVLPPIDEEPPPGLTLVPAFPNLQFFRPVFLTHAPDGNDEIYVVEQQGTIRVFENDPRVRSTRLFFDARRLVTMRGNEQGLLGFAFHPDFASNGEFFVNYSARRFRGDTIISRFKVGADGVGDPRTEEVLLRVEQPFENHNGGMLAFGPDGLLYIGFGDGGHAGDPFANGQNPATLLGTIARIDVNRRQGGRPYAIPASNPFARSDTARGEIYTWGMRNPWRFSFDRETGELWCADVGQERYEEIDIIRAGGNYGWNGYEGFVRYDRRAAGRVRDHVEPLLHYPADAGKSVTGGYVYRGPTIGWLVGRYVFADYVSGAVWAARRGETRAQNDGILLPPGRWRAQPGVRVFQIVPNRLPIASFGEDMHGELYACSFDGAIYKFEGGAPPIAPHAARLADTGLLDEEGDPAGERTFRYDVNVALWSDGAAKDRFLELPEGARLGYRRDGAWEVPEGTRFVKTFSYEKVRGDASSRTLLETRVIRREASGWSAVTYVHDEAGNAELLEGSRSVTLQVREPDGSVTRKPWYFPSQNDCFKCHTAVSGTVLGITTAQLNRGGQIARLREQGLLAGAPADAESQPRHPSLGDPSASLEARARAYLEANCSFCHRPGASGNARIDLRAEIPLLAARMVGERPAQNDLGLGGRARIVAPGDPEVSVLLQRMRMRGDALAMPPLASAEPHEEALDVIERWIRGMR